MYSIISGVLFILFLLRMKKHCTRISAIFLFCSIEKVLYFPSIILWYIVYVVTNSFVCFLMTFACFLLTYLCFIVTHNRCESKMAALVMQSEEMLPCNYHTVLRAITLTKKRLWELQTCVLFVLQLRESLKYANGTEFFCDTRSLISRGFQLWNIPTAHTTSNLALVSLSCNRRSLGFH
jgi:hypothetical protein